MDAVGLGAKSADKVKEILRKGHSAKAVAAAENERGLAIAAFVEVWGAGPSVAQQWYGMGCRTLDDVRQKAAAGEIKLSEQQRVGLKYYDDIATPIPRAEVGAAEAIAREAAFELVEALGAAAPERTYAFAAGSYSRGKSQSSDIDILVVLPPSLPNQDCGEFLHSLLGSLLRREFLLDELDHAGRRAAHGSSALHASWMGLCLPPGAPGPRRIDVKVYAHASAACAVNYFANSQSVCRATRYWSNNAAPAVAAAAKLNPAANGFKISDSAMVPIVRRSARERPRGEEAVKVLAPPVEIRCETDIFETLGLSYVPISMRFFHDFV